MGRNISREFIAFKRELLIRDPNATAFLTKPDINDSGLHSTTIADIHITSKGKSYKYAVVNNPFNGVTVLPIVNK